MSRNRLTVFLIGILAAAATSLVLRLGPDEGEAGAAAWRRAPPSDLVGHLLEATGTIGAARPRVSPEARVAVEVARRNHAANAEAEAFTADGWSFVDAPPPDARLVGYDPSLLKDGREAELRVQLASTVAGRRDVANLATIAGAANDPATRMAAVEALVRAGGPDAQDALMALLVDGNLAPADPARQMLPAVIRPADLDDPLATRMASLLAGTFLSPAEKKQIAFTLALVGLRDGMSLPEATLATLTADARALLDDMTVLARTTRLGSEGREHVHASTPSTPSTPSITTTHPEGGHP